jgi:hypothetical protein
VVDQSTGTESFYASTRLGLPGTFAARPVRCDIAGDLLLAQVVPVSAIRIALLCAGNATLYYAAKSVYLLATLVEPTARPAQPACAASAHFWQRHLPATWPWHRLPKAPTCTSTTATTPPGPR